MKEHGFMRQTSWNLSQPSSDLLQVEMLEWPTPPCTVGDSRRFAPRMRGSATTAWMRAKGRGNSTWWCAQRGHLQGVQRLVNTVPGADFYLLIDADTQGVRRPLTLPEPMSSHAPRSHAPTRYSQAPTYASRPSSEHEPHRLFCLHRSVSARHGLTSHAAGAPHPAAARGSLRRAPSQRVPTTKCSAPSCTRQHGFAAEAGAVHRHRRWRAAPRLHVASTPSVGYARYIYHAADEGQLALVSTRLDPRAGDGGNPGHPAQACSFPAGWTSWVWRVDGLVPRVRVWEHWECHEYGR